jgi:hypothetical protein
VVISESILAILAMLYFRTGRWKKNTIDFWGELINEKSPNFIICSALKALS